MMMYVKNKVLGAGPAEVKDAGNEITVTYEYEIGTVKWTGEFKGARVNGRYEGEWVDKGGSETFSGDASLARATVDGRLLFTGTWRTKQKNGKFTDPERWTVDV